MTHLTKYFALIALVTFISSCSGPAVYKPEVDGPGTKVSRGDTVYPIPPNAPVIRMKLASAVQPKGKTLRVRMLFIRNGSPAGEYLDPREQKLSFPDSNEKLTPTRIHASTAGKPMIQLTGSRQQIVELYYAVPTAGDEFPYIKLNWVVHYTQKGVPHAESQTVRFDYVEKTDSQQGVKRYEGSEEFPDAGLATIPDIWIPGDYGWW
jgi:hypothetical protein